MERRKFITLGAVAGIAGRLHHRALHLQVLQIFKRKKRGIRKGRVHGRFAWILLPSDQLP
jgi:hypothetical protein